MENLLPKITKKYQQNFPRGWNTIPFFVFNWQWDNDLNSLSANLTKWLNTLKEFVGTLPMNCLSAFDHFEGLAL